MRHRVFSLSVLPVFCEDLANTELARGKFWFTTKSAMHTKGLGFSDFPPIFHPMFFVLKLFFFVIFVLL